LDRVRKGRSADIRGEKNNLAKLTDDQVREMRALHVPRSHEWGRNALARRFGVSETTVDRIINHEMWTHI
jgi:AraC-like DNA-binding protein